MTWLKPPLPNSPEVEGRVPDGTNLTRDAVAVPDLGHSRPLAVQKLGVASTGRGSRRSGREISTGSIFLSSKLTELDIRVELECSILYSYSTSLHSAMSPHSLSDAKLLAALIACSTPSIVIPSSVHAQQPPAPPTWFKSAGELQGDGKPKSQPLDGLGTSVVKTPLPQAVSTAAGLESLNPGLGKLLPKLPAVIGSSQVSPKFKSLYQHEANWIARGINLNRENYFDCASILNLTAPNGQKIVLLQTDMDADTDGSDPVRKAAVADYEAALTSTTFQPGLSYQWDNTTDAVNPFIQHYASMKSGIQKSQEEMLKALGNTQGVAWKTELSRAVKTLCDKKVAEVDKLVADNNVAMKKKRSLISSEDPFIVIPQDWPKDKSDTHACQLGDYAAVVYKGKIYPAIVADLGPVAKTGEASLRLNRVITPTASGRAGAISGPKATYLIFPGTANTTRGELKLKEMRDKVLGLLKEVGVSDSSSVHNW
jgi:hypothetical protein